MQKAFTEDSAVRHGQTHQMTSALRSLQLVMFALLSCIILGLSFQSWMGVAAVAILQSHCHRSLTFGCAWINDEPQRNRAPQKRFRIGKLAVGIHLFYPFLVNVVGLDSSAQSAQCIKQTRIPRDRKILERWDDFFTILPAPALIAARLHATLLRELLISKFAVEVCSGCQPTGTDEQCTILCNFYAR